MLHQIGVRQLLRVRTVECAGVRENGAPEAEIVRHEGKREANFCRRRPEGLTAERITGYRITRADAGRSEATDRLAAFEEVVDRPDILAIPAHDVSANRPPYERDLLRYRIIPPTLRDGAQVVDRAAHACEILSEREVKAARGILAVVTRIIDERVANRGGDCSTGDFPHSKRSSRLQIIDVFEDEGVVCIQPEVIEKREAKSKAAAGPQILVTCIGIAGRGRIVCIPGEDINAERHIPVKEARLGPAHIRAAAHEASRHLDLQILAGTEEISFAVGYFTNDAFSRRVTHCERQLARRLFFQRD